jgi:hypothetical protein
MEGTQTFNDVSTGLLNHGDVGNDDYQRKNDEQSKNNQTHSNTSIA